jgi:hypothetical protein
MFGDVAIKAYIKFIPNFKRNIADELTLYRELHKMGVTISINDIWERFNLTTPNDGELMSNTRTNLKILTKLRVKIMHVECLNV